MDQGGGSGSRETWKRCETESITLAGWLLLGNERTIKDTPRILLSLEQLGVQQYFYGDEQDWGRKWWGWRQRKSKDLSWIC